jgi:alpha-L-fucosidase
MVFNPEEPEIVAHLIDSCSHITMNGSRRNFKFSGGYYRMAGKSNARTLGIALAAFSIFLLADLRQPVAAAPKDESAAETADATAQDKAAAPASAADKKARDQRLAWWSDARFGMFIHWGLYAQDGCFWKGQDGKTEHMMRHLQIPLVEYAKIADDFNPVKFNADEWAKIAKDAGMKYMIITSKHHDGFAMYDSPSSDYNIVRRTPWHRDPVKELSEACARNGLKFGVYYSLGRDWQDPDVPTSIKPDGSRRSNTWDYPDEDKKDFSKYFERKVKPQVRELLTQYGPIAVMWFDTPEKISKAQSQELVGLIHSLQPDCIVNQRVGGGLGDYAVQEQQIPKGGEAQPWETCMTLNGHWGYKKNDSNWKPTETLLRNLIDIASKGGNFLLNVGPTGEGQIPSPSVERLGAVGQWMKVNGQSIYGTTASPLKQKIDWGRCTKKVGPDGTTLYLHVFNWPADGKLVVPGLRSNVESAKRLADGSPLAAKSTEQGVVIEVPKTAPDRISSTVVLKLNGDLKVE